MNKLLSKTKILGLFFILFLGSIKFAWSRPGDLDVSFGPSGGGFVIENSREHFMGNAELEDSILLPDAKILATGKFYPTRMVPTYLPFFISRFNSNGSPDDTSFGIRSSVSVFFTVVSPDISFTSPSSAQANTLVLQSNPESPDNYNIIVGGVAQTISEGSTRTQPRGNLSFALIRLNASGLQDRSFGPATPVPEMAGKITTDFNNRVDRINTIAISSNRNIFATGPSCEINSEDMQRDCRVAIAKYNPNGILDTSFGPRRDGKVLLDLGSSQNFFPTSMIVLADEKILISGTADHGYGNSHDYFLLRLNPDGSLDHDFGESGWGAILGNFGEYHTRSDGSCLYDVSAPTQDFFNSMAIQHIIEEEKIILGGVSNGKIAALRFDMSGRHDPSFACNGKSSTPSSPGDVLIHKIAIQRNNKILFAGKIENNIALARFNMNGGLDNEFGYNGIAQSNFGNPLNRNVAKTIHVFNEKALIGGSTIGGNCWDSISAPYCHFIFARYELSSDSKKENSPELKENSKEELHENYSPHSMEKVGEGEASSYKALPYK